MNNDLFEKTLMSVAIPIKGTKENIFAKKIGSLFSIFQKPFFRRGLIRVTLILMLLLFGAAILGVAQNDKRISKFKAVINESHSAK